MKSGRISPYFFNSGLFNTGLTIRRLGEIYASTFMGAHIPIPPVVYGPAYKGIPLSVVTAAGLSQLSGVDVGYSFNRKEEKTHGDGGILVGYPVDGCNVLIVDDVMTTGRSSGEAVEIVRAQGGTPIACVIAFDRQERGQDSDSSAVQEFQNNYGIPVHSVATLGNLITYLQGLPPESGDDNNGEILEKILAYQKEYGVA